MVGGLQPARDFTVGEVPSEVFRHLVALLKKPFQLSLPTNTLTVLIDEAQPVRGLAHNFQTVFVHILMSFRAHRDQILRHRQPAVGVKNNVMHIQPDTVLTTRHRAAMTVPSQ